MHKYNPQKSNSHSANQWSHNKIVIPPAQAILPTQWPKIQTLHIPTWNIQQHTRERLIDNPIDLTENVPARHPTGFPRSHHIYKTVTSNPWFWFVDSCIIHDKTWLWLLWKQL